MLTIFDKHWFTFQLHAHFIALSLLMTLKSHGTLWKNTVLPLISWPGINPDNHSNISYTYCSSNWNHWFSLTAPGLNSVFRLTVGCYVAAAFSDQQFSWGLLERCSSKKVLEAGQWRYCWWFILIFILDEKKSRLDVRLIEKSNPQPPKRNQKQKNTPMLHWIWNSWNLFQTAIIKMYQQYATFSLVLY